MLIAVEEVQAEILAACPVLGTRRVGLGEALGLVLAELVCAGEDVPPFANTAMDGYAVRAGDTTTAPVRLEVVGTIAAGAAPVGGVGPGQAMRIMTGALIPSGSDAVVMVEQTSTTADDRGVVVNIVVQPGDHIRPAGSDIVSGQTVFEPGTVLGAGHLGVLASLGLCEVEAFRRARVGVLSTGDELVEGPQALQPGQIRDSNRPVLLALLADAGLEAVDLGIARDDPESIAAAVSVGADRCDALVTSGGVSVGDFDHMKSVLDRLGDMCWWQVAVKPAKPLAFGLVRNTTGHHVPVFGLPGNPVSSMVSFELFASPALRQMSGHRRLFRSRLRAVAEGALLRRPDGKVHMVRVALRVDDEGRLMARPAGGQGSHMLAAMARADALALLPDGDGVDEGGEVSVMPLGSLWA